MLFKTKKLLFILPPKCGTSSFVNFIKENTSLITPFNEVGRHFLLSEKVKNLKSEGENFQDYQVYQICRNPLNRIVSSFLYQEQIALNRRKRTPHKRNPKKNFRPRRALHNLNFESTFKLLSPLIPHCPAFELNQQSQFNKTKFYLEKLAKHPHPFFKNTNMLYWQFYMPQYMWNNIDTNVTYLKLEDLSKDCSILSDIFKENLPKQFPTTNTTQLPNKRPAIEYFNVETKKLLFEIYYQDFITLGYDLV